MRILVIGANGFVGRALVQRLLDSGSLGRRSIETLILVDTTLEGFPGDNRLRYFSDSITKPAFLRRILADGIDLVFHLASIPGGAAEEQYSLGYPLNLLASLELLDQLRTLPSVPVMVYASSVAVYGGNLPSPMNEQASPRPELSYGAHKLMIEIAINDLSRRGELDGRAVRLPGIVARPRQPNGLRSAFMSEVMHAVANKEPYQVPVSSQATAWWMSAKCCVDNLLHAAQLQDPGPRRVWQLPVLHLAMQQVVDALVARFGEDRRSLIQFSPDENLEALFGRFPPLQTPDAIAAGFRHDGTAQDLVSHSLHLTG